MKKSFRDLERNTLKLERNKSHLMFNETCYNNDILPTYTNMKLYQECLIKNEKDIELKVRVTYK